MNFGGSLFGGKWRIERGKGAEIIKNDYIQEQNLQIIKKKK